MQLPKPIGCCRNLLGWDIPKHYTAGEMIRLLRNAVMHGGELPTKDSGDFRNAFDRWNLFLFRRVLMRLGYGGRVCSPYGQFAASSPVDDFSEQHNTFP